MNVAVPLPAPALAPAAASTTGTVRANYARRLWEWIAARRPAGLHLEGEALISFSIGPRGDLRGLSLDRSSGNAQLDRLALRTVRLAAPFPRPPESLDAEELNFVLPFHFN
jgi:protein TonB